MYDFLCALEEAELDNAAFHAVYQQNLTNPSVYYRVAEAGGEVVGFVSCHVQLLLHHGGRVGEIQELYVRPDWRRQGVGQRLLAEVQAIAHQENFSNLEVTTNQKRLDAIRFYERAAFHLSHYKLVKPILP